MGIDSLCWVFAMTAKTLLWTALAACLLGGCGSRSPRAAETKSEAAAGTAPRVAEAAQQDSDAARDGDWLLREVERTIARPAPRPLLPLLKLESGGPAEGTDR
jgi:hypothetical protein